MKTVLVEPLTISEDLLQKLSQPLREGDNEFVAYDSKPQNKEEWLERTKDCDQLILANTKMPVEVITQNDKLAYINIAFTGVDHVPVKEAKEKGIVVSNAAGYSDEGVAELVIALSISLLRQVREADRGIRKGGKAADFLGQEVYGKTVGIIGTGHIGSRVAELFHVMGAKLLGYSRSEREACKKLGLTYVSLEELLKKSDIVTVHLPQNEETKNFLSGKELSLMKESAILINCARGPIVNSEELAKALKKGAIAGAGVDVFNQEPPLSEEALLEAPNALLTPHVAYFTVEAMEKRAQIVFENAVDFLEGRDVKTAL